MKKITKKSISVTMIILLVIYLIDKREYFVDGFISVFS
jgi:hypothetical protein